MYFGTFIYFASSLFVQRYLLSMIYFSAGRDNYGLRENSEMVVSDVCLKGMLKY